MVDGVHSFVDHVVGHVVMEHKLVLEVAVILHLPVEEEVALANMLLQDHVQMVVVLVR